MSKEVAHHDPTSLTGLTIASAYRLGRKIGAGNLGELRIAKSTATSSSSTSTLYGVKLEPTETTIPLLKMKHRFYRTLACPGSPHVPASHYYGTINKYNALVLDLLGPSLEDLFDLCNSRFSLKTTCQIALQLLSAFEYIHSKSLVHRDAKPENLLLGRPSTGKDKTIHVIDFGLSKEYVDPRTKEHIPFRDDKSLTWTLRYMSINTHLNRERSRRDDLETLAYTFLYFLKGAWALPWQGLKTSSFEERSEKIGEMKLNTSVEELVEEPPDYGCLKGLWERILKRHGWETDGEFDWTGKVMRTPIGSLQKVLEQNKEEQKKEGEGDAVELLPQVVVEDDKGWVHHLHHHEKEIDELKGKEKDLEKDKKGSKLNVKERGSKDEKVREKGALGGKEEKGKVLEEPQVKAEGGVQEEAERKYRLIGGKKRGTEESGGVEGRYIAEKILT